MGRFPAVMVSAVTLAAACCAVVAGTALPAGASPQAVGTWGSAQEVLGSAGQIVSVSCGSPGNCAAVGPPLGSSQQPPFVVDEVNGSWGAGQAVPGWAALNAGGEVSVTSVSCASAGNCAAGGNYTDSSVRWQGFVVDEVNGSWGKAQEVPGLAALNVSGDAYVSSVSCASAGNCAAVGSYLYVPLTGSAQGFVADEVNGSWGKAQEVPGLAALNADGSAWVSAVSCASAGYCAAGGTYTDSSGVQQAYVADEVNGSWGTAEQVPGSAAGASITSVSCASAGNCAAGGSAGGQAFVADEVNGSWGAAEQVPGSAALDVGGSAWVSSVSCPSAGNCAAVGNTSYTIAPGEPVPQVFVVDESGGSWGTAEALPGASTGTAGFIENASISCGSAGNCVAAGTYQPGGTTPESPFLAEETGGSWGTAHEPPGYASNVTNPYAASQGGGVSSVSCASAGNCTVGGTYLAGNQAFVVDERPSTSTVLSLSAAKVTYGHEQAERVSVAVSAPSGIPSGTVTVKAGTAVLCGNVSTSAGRASCTVPATRLPAGTWHLTASYGGSGSGWASTSAAKTLTVTKAAAKITLSLSAATVTYGHEGSERLTVKVTGQYAGTPAGKVTVKSGKSTVCTITLAAGKGSCTLAARKLPAGTRTLIAAYSGSGDFTGATSAPKTLKVVT